VLCTTLTLASTLRRKNVTAPDEFAIGHPSWRLGSHPLPAPRPHRKAPHENRRHRRNWPDRVKGGAGLDRPGTHRRRQSRPAEISFEEITEWDLDGLCSAEAEVLEAVPDSQIQAAMHALPEGFRAAVYYADVYGYTYAETAAILNIPLGTAMSRASRARRRLRTALAERQVA
jgi:Sigma-70, region 4